MSLVPAWLSSDWMTHQSLKGIYDMASRLLGQRQMAKAQAFVKYVCNSLISFYKKYNIIK